MLCLTLHEIPQVLFLFWENFHRRWSMNSLDMDKFFLTNAQRKVLFITSSTDFIIFQRHRTLLVQHHSRISLLYHTTGRQECWTEWNLTNRYLRKSYTVFLFPNYIQTSEVWSSLFVHVFVSVVLCEELEKWNTYPAKYTSKEMYNIQGFWLYCDSVMVLARVISS